MLCDGLSMKEYIWLGKMRKNRLNNLILSKKNGEKP